MQLTTLWKSTKQDLWFMASHRKRELSIETFAPVARYTSIRAIISLASVLGWRLHQMDLKTAFLNGIIEEEVYIE